MFDSPYDALLIVSFGGPEKMEDVVPFLENVLRGRNVPRERLLEVAHHYELFNGVSPINAQCRELISALQAELASHEIHLPIYWGNRNWHPFLEETMREMTTAGVRRVLAFATSAFGSYSGCRQYQEDIARALVAVGDQAPHVDKLRPCFNHPLFIDANVERMREALIQIPTYCLAETQLVFTAHSIPLSMARQGPYVEQLEETCRLITERLGWRAGQWRLVYQSRSGRPEDPWLDPDILDHLRTLHTQGTTDVVVMPVGFLSDHMEVMYDLDVEAQGVAKELGLNLVRAHTVGTHPLFIRMLCELFQERLSGGDERAAIGCLPARPDACPADCCPPPARRPAAASRPTP